MSKKCRAYSESKLGTEPTNNRKAFYAGWGAALRAALAQQQAGSWQDGVLEGHLRERERWLAQQEEPDTCTWHQDGDSDSGTYSTSCGHYFRLEDGTPEDNKMQWCCYCGKQLAQELITEDDDE